MRALRWTMWLVAALFLLLSPSAMKAQDVGAQGSYTGASTMVRCRSTDGRFRHCAVGGWVRGAQLQQQLGGAPCAQGRSWDYDDRGVWVDRGCQGNFRVWTGGRPTGRSTVMRCSSQDGGRKRCPVSGEVIRSAYVEQQFSGSPCIQGSTWGFDSRNVWVDRGCRADFRVWLSR